MVELIVVMVLIGIIGTVAAARFFDRGGFDAAAWSDRVKSMLRQGQKIAIAQNRPVFVLLAPERVALCLEELADCRSAAQVRAPGGANSGSEETRAACGADAWMCEGTPAGVRMPVPGAAVRFDGLGRAAGGGVIAVTDGSLVHTVRIDPETGHVD